MLIGGVGSPYYLVECEMQQCREEGLAIPAELERSFQTLAADRDAWNEPAITAIQVGLAELRRIQKSPWQEPDELEAIRALRPAGSYRLSLNLSDDELRDKFHGAWLGRSLGCALGKPVEPMGMWEGGRRSIRSYLENRQAWPLADFIPFTGGTDGKTVQHPDSCRENICFMESDDDIRYTLIGLAVLEQFGGDFAWTDVASYWNRVLPMAITFTAERQALLNYNMVLDRVIRQEPGAKEFIRSFNNPFREWIGAQIRADFWGWACAGQPERAAEFAWRDASWTHVKNGIYGEMFFAALEAAAFVESDPGKLIEIGLSEIPAECRLAAAIRKTVAAVKDYPDTWHFMELVEAEFPAMSPVHTVNNAMICCAALLYGGLDPEKTVCEAVSAGLDTDCNGATVGAIAGIVAGRRNFPGTMAGRLNDTIRAAFDEFQCVGMGELAERTLSVYRRLNGDGGAADRG